MESEEKKLRDIGDQYLIFWGACLRERSASDGLYSQWYRYHSQFGDKAIEEIVKYALRGKAAHPDDPSMLLFKFAQVEVALTEVMKDGAYWVRPLCEHYYVAKLPVHKWRHPILEHLFLGYRRRKGLERWLWETILDLRVDIGRMVMDKDKWFKSVA